VTDCGESERERERQGERNGGGGGVIALSQRSMTSQRRVDLFFPVKYLTRMQEAPEKENLSPNIII
jgi:hypothetical protein